MNWHPLSSWGDPTLAVGCFCLITLSLLAQPKAAGGRAWCALASALLGLLVGACWIHLGFLRLGYWPKTENRGYTAHTIEQVREEKGRFATNILILEGGSYAARAIDAEALETQLEKRGYSVRVLPFCRPGAPQLERVAELQHFVRQAGPAVLAELNQRNLLLLSEIHAGYNLNPVSQLSSNLFSSRTLGYLQPDLTRQAIQGLWLSHLYDGTKAPTAGVCYDVLSHGLLNAFNVGALLRYEHWTETKTLSPRFGLDQNKKKPVISKFPITNILNEFTRAATNQPLDLRWLQLVDADLTATGLKYRRVYFSTPSHSRDNLQHIARFEATFTQTSSLSLAGETNLLMRLSPPEMWYDDNHLNKFGAEVYTEWLGNQIVAEGLLIH